MRRLASAATALGLLGSALAASACAQPTATPSATRCARVIRNTDAAKSVTLVDHACATLRLGSGLAWSTPKSSSTRVRVTKAGGANAWYLTAVRTGTATITSAGRPSCAAGQACPAFIVAFRLPVRVVAKGH